MLSFLSSLFSSSKVQEKDLSFGLMAEYSLDKVVRGNQWTDLEALAKKLTSDQLSRLLDGICLSLRYQPQLASYAPSATSEFGRVVAGAWYLFLAWHARTAKLGNQLTQSEVDGFFHYLELAEKSLNRPFVNKAFESEAHARLVRVWMGLNEKELAIENFKRSIELDDSKFWAYHHLFKVKSAKWLGDKDELREFVNSVRPPTLSYALRAMYLIEVFDDLDSANSQQAPKLWYADNQASIEELRAHPGIPVDNSLVSVYAANNMAYFWHLLGETGKRNQLLDQMQDHQPMYPWAYFGLDTPSAMKKFRAVPAYAQLRIGSVG